MQDAVLDINFVYMGIYKKPRPFNHIFGGDRNLRAWYRGSSEGFSGIETSAFSWNVWQSCKFSTPKTCETCREQWSQCNMPIMCGKRINVVEKMPWNLFDVFVNVFCFKSKIFIVRLSVERVELSIPTTFVVLGCWHLRCRGPGNHLRWHAAAHCRVRRPHQGCRAFAFKRGHGGCHEQWWRGASKREAGRESRLQLGAPQKSFLPGLKFEKKMSAFSANVWQSCEFPM